MWLIAWTHYSLLIGLGGGVEDATLTLFDLISSHLDSAGTTVRVMFMDFSSAFNTIQPHVFLNEYAMRMNEKKRIHNSNNNNNNNR